MKSYGKKAAAIAAALILLFSTLTGCAGTSMKEVTDAIDAAFMADVGTVAVPVGRSELSKDAFLMATGLSADDIKDYYGVVSSDDGYCDRIIAVRAGKNSIETVKAALEQMKTDLTAYYRSYSVNGSYQRAQLSQIVERGDCLFYICLGMMPTDTDAPLEFGIDLDLAVNTINNYYPPEN
ncbi:MAG TPA: DUF4358 domain-containing protein [Oscillospiraceae bacterium]|nr:DUF4358 domain-containing protein [Oscillospiraceae bacterium]HPK35419.1 DUF4358 domain-containing protein [Oscillospiraceae bacterium]HPR75143.1 DUF4358 domain-containing protein [Oscillospiraceae bacterium]